MENDEEKMKLVDALQDALRVKNYAYSTEKTYLHWIRQYVRFHLPVHPRDVGVEGVSKFLTYLAKERNVSASTHLPPAPRTKRGVRAVPGKSGAGGDPISV
jgi:hypothetical protein